MAGWGRFFEDSVLFLDNSAVSEAHSPLPDAHSPWFGSSLPCRKSPLPCRSFPLRWPGFRLPCGRFRLSCRESPLRCSGGSLRCRGCRLPCDGIPLSCGGKRRDGSAASPGWCDCRLGGGGSGLAWGKKILRSGRVAFARWLSIKLLTDPRFLMECGRDFSKNGGGRQDLIFKANVFPSSSVEQFYFLPARKMFSLPPCRYPSSTSPRCASGKPPLGPPARPRPRSSAAWASALPAAPASSRAPATPFYFSSAKVTMATTPAPPPRNWMAAAPNCSKFSCPKVICSSSEWRSPKNPRSLWTDFLASA